MLLIFVSLWLFAYRKVFSLKYRNFALVFCLLKLAYANRAKMVSNSRNRLEVDGLTLPGFIHSFILFLSFSCSLFLLLSKHVFPSAPTADQRFLLPSLDGGTWVLPTPGSYPLPSKTHGLLGESLGNHSKFSAKGLGWPQHGQVLALVLKSRFGVRSCCPNVAAPSANLSDEQAVFWKGTEAGGWQCRRTNEQTTLEVSTTLRFPWNSNEK